ncbi:helix-turn-helix domain-containing protein [Wansuia hejianensis]|uniref:Helix-turn-helix domain-containing protein n=1 Tax=Wansuia hejianensis TaxID=2763667 RepID=A0A926IM38_9FIRM|nr:helix-turn-helix domain-containing protein [Wansuia hejianensis]MBC8590191.1 helix-turn-helix domain-containing protein [Wansuia hejianensis]
MSRSKHDSKVKLIVIERYLDGESVTKLAEEIDVSIDAILDWTNMYETFGIDGLVESKSKTRYSEELKISAVRDHLNGVDSLRNICKKYGIRSHKTLRSWILKYNNNEMLKSCSKGSSKSMKKGRKTTHEERVKIAKHCIENDYNYIDTAGRYTVSYQQVYSWVKKFEDSGEKGLIDRRGKSKEEISLTEEDKLKIKIRKLEKQNRELEVENALLKKLEELKKRSR